MFVRFSQCQKTPSLIDFKPLGNLIVFKLAHSEKVSTPMDFTEEGILIFSRFSQCQKTPFLIDFKPLGNLIVSKLEQSEKAYSLIFFTELGITTFLTFEPANAPLPIEVTYFGMVNELPFFPLAYLINFVLLLL